MEHNNLFQGNLAKTFLSTLNFVLDGATEYFSRIPLCIKALEINGVLAPIRWEALSYDKSKIDEVP